MQGSTYLEYPCLLVKRILMEQICANLNAVIKAPASQTALCQKERMQVCCHSRPSVANAGPTALTLNTAASLKVLTRLSSRTGIRQHLCRLNESQAGNSCRHKRW